ncbi:hypothetical protein F6W96_39295 [Nocardia terpenica]|uniref:Uncharacterized protein n=1 Tax=Nocardia terpenica TaxID=455432 RepID=A0A6G9ZD38_9NOCA|nr:hypothetical protein F6W96_39295 [Nocardia terpenica]
MNPGNGYDGDLQFSQSIRWACGGEPGVSVNIPVRTKSVPRITPGPAGMARGRSMASTCAIPRRPIVV